MSHPLHPEFVYTVRVSYADTDAMRFVHHARYLVYFECARTELLRATGSSYAEWERLGYLLPVTRAEVDFRRPAYYDDLLEIGVQITKLDVLRLAFDYTVRRKGEEQVLARAHTQHVFMNEKGGPRRAPRNLLAPLQDWLGGERSL